ncbi:MAG: hypothetical protein ACKOA2_05105 [Ilumatobacteraceae bacterium]
MTPPLGSVVLCIDIVPPEGESTVKMVCDVRHISPRSFVHCHTVAAWAMMWV